ncbi:MAG: hypothetical protein IJ191_06920, partial [Treponema sp.]|nr:hypothetical protein [Treponema sp.]
MKRVSPFIERNGLLVSPADGTTLALDAVAVCSVDSVLAGVCDAQSGVPAVERGGAAVVAVPIPEQMVLLSDGAFNEQFLATVRLYLKQLEKCGIWALLLPDDASVSVVVHAARRVKDCTAVVGVVLPPEFTIAGAAKATALIAALTEKHGDYHYFSAVAGGMAVGG